MIRHTSSTAAIAWALFAATAAQAKDPAPSVAVATPATADGQATAVQDTQASAGTEASAEPDSRGRGSGPDQGAAASLAAAPPRYRIASTASRQSSPQEFPALGPPSPAFICYADTMHDGRLREREIRQPPRLAAHVTDTSPRRSASVDVSTCRRVNIVDRYAAPIRRTALPRRASSPRT